jgi:hypothetical protein
VEVQTPNCGSAVFSTSKTITVISGTPPTGGSVSSAVHATTTNSGTLTLSGHTGTIVKWQRSVNNGVTWTDIANTGTTNSYTNQTDATLFRAQLQSGTCGFTFSNAGVIVVAPFAYSGYVYNAEGVGVSGITVKLHFKLKTQSTYTLLGTYTTDVSGKYTITTNESVNLNDFRIIVGESISILAPDVTDAQFFNQKIFTQSFNSKDYYRMDVNNNNILSITDVVLIFQRKNNVIPSWLNSTPNYRLFTAAQWSVINGSNSNLKTTYSGTQSITMDNLSHNGATNFYIIRTGYKQ